MDPKTQRTFNPEATRALLTDRLRARLGREPTEPDIKAEMAAERARHPLRHVHVSAEDVPLSLAVRL